MASPLYLGVEIGGTKLQAGVGPGDGSILWLERRAIEPARGAEAIRANIVESTAALRAKLGGRSIEAVGIGFGGPVDAARGVTTLSNHVRGWSDFPLASWAIETLGVPRARIENDADVAALGEASFGAGVGASPLLYLTIGSGIGGGLIIDGQIYRGSGAGAVEIGHLVVEGERTLESLASGWSIAREARERLAIDPAPPDSPLLARCGHDLARIDAAMVARAAVEGDAAACSVMASAHAAMGRALAVSVNLFAPKRIILGGGVSLIGEDGWFDPIRRATARHVFAPFRGTYDIVAAALGEEVVIHGALALAARCDV